LSEVEGFRCSLPKGAFYAFPNIKAFRWTSSDFSKFLLNKAGVFVTPGSSFGDHGEGFLRLSFSAAYEEINEALDRIEKVAKSFQRT
jgi:aminotransferase